MAIELLAVLTHGNLKRFVKTEVLPHDVWCPICEQFVYGRINVGDEYQIEPECDCDMDGHNQELNEANSTIEAREERVEDLEIEVKGLEQDIKELEKEVERLEQELMDAK